MFPQALVSSKEIIPFFFSISLGGIFGCTHLTGKTYWILLRLSDVAAKATQELSKWQGTYGSLITYVASSISSYDMVGTEPKLCNCSEINNRVSASFLCTLMDHPSPLFLKTFG